MAAKKVNLVGVAALVTAISTAGLAFWQQYSKTQYNAKMMKSMFAIMDYRLQRIEKKLKIETPPVFMGMMGAVGTAEPVGEMKMLHSAEPAPMPMDFDTMQKVVDMTGKAVEVPQE